MARRNSNTAVLEDEDSQGTETTPAEEVSTEAVEGAVEASETETDTESGTEGDRDTSGDTEHTDGEVSVSLAPFEQAVAAVVAQRDTTTGELPEGVVEPALAQYRELGSTKDRNRAKAYLKDQMKEAMSATDLPLARAFFVVQESLTTAPSKSGADRKPADPLAVWKHNLLTSLLAYGELAGVSKPEGENIDATVAEIQAASQATETVEEMNAYRAWLDNEAEDKGDAPKVRAEVIHAFRLARGNKRRGVGTGGGERTPHDGPRRDLGRHIEEAFAAVEPGTFLSVADIRKFQSDEYGDEQPSAGAISARLFPAKGECTVPGVTPGTGGEKNTKGAYKNEAEAEDAA